MPTPLENITQSLAKLKNANRIKGSSASYKTDNPTEYNKVLAYLNGGARPTGVTTDMGLGLMLEEDARRALAPPPPPATWVKVADEGQNFTLTETKEVRFGVGSSWSATQVLPAGTHTCNTFFFGDPLPGAQKQCEAKTAGGAPPPNPPPTGGTVIPSNGVISSAGLWYGDPFVGTVQVSTNQPVTLYGDLRNATGGVLVDAMISGSQVTLDHVTALGGSTYQTSGRLIWTNNHKSLVVKNCSIEYTRGIELEGGQPGSTVLITRNKHKNAQGLVASPVGNLVQFRICQNSTIEVSWNEMVNEYNKSNPEDLVSVLATYNADIHNNFFYGQSTPGNPYSQSSQNGITIEVGSDNVRAHDNQLIAGMAIGIFGGNNCSFHNNRIVRSGFLTDGVTLNKNGYEGAWIATGGSNNHAHGNIIGYVNKDNQRSDGRFPGAPEGDEWPRNTHMGTVTLAVEQNEWTIWQAKLAANGIVLGA